MNKAIEQRIQFRGATAQELFDIFVNPEKHSAIHGGAITKISSKEGDNFSLLNGNLNGKNLLIAPDRMIVQAWRGNVWKKNDLDSILILVFSDTKDGAQIEMVHAFTPDQFTELWNEIYWKPMKTFIRQEKQ
jgi:activator of HSP90 ATPase